MYGTDISELQKIYRKTTTNKRLRVVVLPLVARRVKMGIEVKTHLRDI
jgi:hypothetical protein